MYIQLFKYYIAKVTECPEQSCPSVRMNKLASLSNVGSTFSGPDPYCPHTNQICNCFFSPSPNLYCIIKHSIFQDLYAHD